MELKMSKSREYFWLLPNAELIQSPSLLEGFFSNFEKFGISSKDIADMIEEPHIPNHGSIRNTPGSSFLLLAINNGCSYIVNDLNEDIITVMAAFTPEFLPNLKKALPEIATICGQTKPLKANVEFEENPNIGLRIDRKGHVTKLDNSRSLKRTYPAMLKRIDEATKEMIESFKSNKVERVFYSLQNMKNMQSDDVTKMFENSPDKGLVKKYGLPEPEITIVISDKDERSFTRHAHVLSIDALATILEQRDTYNFDSLIVQRGNQLDLVDNNGDVVKSYSGTDGLEQFPDDVLADFFASFAYNNDWQDDYPNLAVYRHDPKNHGESLLHHPKFYSVFEFAAPVSK